MYITMNAVASRPRQASSGLKPTCCWNQFKARLSTSSRPAKPPSPKYVRLIGPTTAAST